MDFRKVASESVAFLLENSLLLLAGAAAALLWANLDHPGYSALIGTAGHATGAHHLVTPHFFVNDVLMCFFFAIAAKEIWEAMLPGGALSSLRTAATPLLATLGGVAGPALLYLLGTYLLGESMLNRGWAIPCATDIAFSYMVARFLFGARHPAIPFLLLLAIADDAIGLLILALFYSSGKSHLGLFFLMVGAAIAVNLLLKRLGVRSFWAYLVLAGPLSWWGFYQGGIHPALALVPLIPTMPHEAHDKGLFAEQELSEGTQPQDTLNRFAHWWKQPVELILAGFGFVNAGVPLSNIGIPTGLVAGSLIVGKPIGITLMTLLAIKGLRLKLPEGMTLSEVPVLGFVAGIGFTVALFVSTVAFPPGTVLDAAKMGALLSFASAIFAWIAARIARVRQS